MVLRYGPFDWLRSEHSLQNKECSENLTSCTLYSVHCESKSIRKQVKCWDEMVKINFNLGAKGGN